MESMDKNCIGEECLPGGYTLAEWQEHARRDDCLERMVPSDLRQLLGIIERLRNAYTSTDALRSALAKIVHLASEMPDDPMLDRLSSIYVTAYAALSSSSAEIPRNSQVDALRSALAELLAATDPARGRGSDRELDARERAVKVLRGAAISNKEITQSASPAPSTEGLREALAEMIYEVTHLSPREDDGGHRCIISGATLEKARTALGS